MASIHIDHIAMCVWDLDEAIEDWTEILNVLSPEHKMQITRGEGADVVDQTPMIWATFQNPDPTGISIQLWAAGAEDTWVQKVLHKRGEFVHHLAMLSDDLGHTVQQCKDAGIPTLYDTHSNPDSMPWLKWNFIPESKTHGVLIELATRYHAVGDRWYPHAGNAENADLLHEMNERYYGGK